MTQTAYRTFEDREPTTNHEDTIDPSVPPTVPVSREDDRYPRETLMAARDAVLDGDRDADVRLDAPEDHVTHTLLQAANGMLAGDVYAPVEDADDYLLHVETSAVAVEIGATTEDGDTRIVHVYGDRQ